MRLSALLAKGLHGLESALSWLFRYPLLPVQMLIFGLMAWGRLGYEIGVDDLFWSEWPGEQFVNGLCCGLLFGEVLLVRYLLDPDRCRFSFRATLFPGTGAEINRLGQFLALFWIPSLLLLGGLKLLSHDYWAGHVRVWPLFGGLALSAVLVGLLVVLAERSGLLAWIARLVLSGQGPEAVLHSLAMLVAASFALAVGVVCVRHLAGAVMSPIAILCLLLALVNAVYGFIAFHLPGLQHVVLVLLVVLALLAGSSTVSQDNAYKLTFPHLEDLYQEPVRLDEEPAEGEPDKHRRHDHYYALLEAQAAGKAPRPALISSEEPLRRMCERWQAKHKDGSKPRLILVATSGGGIRAAVWTAVVLEGLEREMPEGFRDHIRLFTGASGGMVGATLYVADFERGPLRDAEPDQDTGLGPLSSLLARDSLRRTVQTMLLRDLPSLWVPGRVSWDRGREIERVWAENAPGSAGRSPFQKSFEELKELERQGRRPSLVYSPMLVEDARRLLISNLDLLDLTWTSGDVLGFQPLRDKYHIPGSPLRPLLSLSAVEFFRLFPRATTFEVGTAARMNASFPLIGPGVSLPTDPPRRVVDAGYYDNYGVDLAAQWLARHEQALRAYTSGAVLIEIRAWRNGYARWHFQNQEAEKLAPDPRTGGRRRRDLGAVAASLEWLSTPAEALLIARDRAAWYRNDELLDGLARQFNQPKAGFFTTVAFECEVDAALSWTLPTGEARVIAHAFRRGAKDEAGEDLPPWVRTRVAALRKWFGKGGQ